VRVHFDSWLHRIDALPGYLHFEAIVVLVLVHEHSRGDRTFWATVGRAAVADLVECGAAGVFGWHGARVGPPEVCQQDHFDLVDLVCASHGSQCLPLEAEYGRHILVVRLRSVDLNYRHCVDADIFNLEVCHS